MREVYNIFCVQPNYQLGMVWNSKVHSYRFCTVSELPPLLSVRSASIAGTLLRDWSLPVPCE